MTDHNKAVQDLGVAFDRLNVALLPVMVFFDWMDKHNVILNRQIRLASELKRIGATSITETVQEPTPLDRWIYKNRKL